MSWRCFFKHIPNTTDLMEIIEHGQRCKRCGEVLAIPLSQYFGISNNNKKLIVKLLKKTKI